MIDATLLGACRFDFAVVTDTHFMRVPEGQAVEMESRRRQSARAFHALKMVAAASPDFVVHLGDLVQEFPGSDGFTESMHQALEQLRECGLDPRHVAGNHDVGDKPDPTMPTDWVTTDSLAQYHSLVGPSWFSWDYQDWHFIVLNSQIMNSGLPAEDQQHGWLVADLEANAGKPVVVFMHLAPYLVDPAEPGLAHYDNVDEPARGRLLNLLAQHDVRMLLAGHSHFQFFNRVGDMRSYVVLSTSFTRPGFSESFSSVAPPEQGRDDTAKLGFFLIRMHADGPRVHRIRTNGAEGAPEEDRSYAVTRLPVDLPNSPVGVVARHEIAPNGVVPLAWPSMVRQPMRNDYPLLGCIELGIRHVRIPASDLRDPLQRERLALLRDEGVQVTATWIWSADLDMRNEIHTAGDILDSVEIQLPDVLWPDPDLVRTLQEQSNVPLAIVPLMPRDIVPGKQHARARIGYRVPELAELGRYLEAHDLRLDRIVVRVDAAHNPWDVMLSATEQSIPDNIRQIDWLVELGTTDSRDQSSRVAEALFGAALHPGCRLFLDPLQDLDRTMDVSLGLIDRMSNPNPAFNVARVLNSALFRHESLRTWADAPTVPNARCTGLENDSNKYLLILPDGGPVPLKGIPEIDAATVFDLEHGTSRIAGVVAEVEGPGLIVW